jgi:hypothetical protein
MSADCFRLKTDRRSRNIRTLVKITVKKQFLARIQCDSSAVIILHIYITLTLCPQRGSRGISDIPPRRPRFTKIILLSKFCLVWIYIHTFHVLSPKG